MKESTPLHRAQELVADFMVLAGQDTPLQPVVPDISVRDLRVRLIAEELAELCKHSACHPVDLPLIVDDIADLLYVAYGAAVAYGIDIEPIFESVHAANMQKFG